MKLHDTQLKAWGHRYIMRTFQDKYKFAHVADLGMIAEYQFGSLFEADVTFVNGEGFKRLVLIHISFTVRVLHANSFQVLHFA